MSDEVVVATCDCGNQWLPGESGKGCWACHTALHSDRIRTDRYRRLTEVADVGGESDD